jgi:phage shock protein A
MTAPVDLISALWCVGGMTVGGAVVHFFKRYTDNADQQEKTLPVIAQTIKTLTECMDELKRNIDELYVSRNAHNVELAQINTLHKVLKCIDKVRP